MKIAFRSVCVIPKVMSTVYTERSASMGIVERKHSKPFLCSHEGNQYIITAVLYRTTYTLANRHVLLSARCKETISVHIVKSC